MQQADWLINVRRGDVVFTALVSVLFNGVVKRAQEFGGLSWRDSLWLTL